MNNMGRTWRELRQMTTDRKDWHKLVEALFSIRDKRQNKKKCR